VTGVAVAIRIPTFRLENEYELFYQYDRQHPDQIQRLLDWEFSELDVEGPWSGPYAWAAEVIPTDYTILDLGCYLGTQAVVFQNHVKYIGIDTSGAPTLHLANTEYHPADIAEVVAKPEKFLGSDLSKVAALSFFVPDFRTVAQTEKLRQVFPNHAVVYPREQPILGGLFGACIKV